MANVEERTPLQQHVVSILHHVINARIDNCLIPRVTDAMRSDERNDQFFYPLVVSLGPYHHGQPQLERMEQYKLVALKQYFSHNNGSSAPNPITEMHFITSCFLSFFRTEAINAKKWYEIDDLDEDEQVLFVWMMFVDISFILNFMKQAVGTRTPDPDVAGGGHDASFRLSSHEEALVVRDIMLLENQIPFELVRIFCDIKRYVESFIHSEDGRRSTEEQPVTRARLPFQATRFVPAGPQPQQQQPQSSRTRIEPCVLMNAFVDKLIRHFRLQPETPTSSSLPSSHSSDQAEPKHLLDLLRRKIIGEESSSNHSDDHEQQSTGGQWYSFRSMKELKEAGIKFRKSSDTNQLKNIRFNSKLFRGELYLPVIMVDDSTKSRLLNIMAYEMGQGGPPDRAVTSYAWFMDSLIDSAEDVKELRSKGILLNALGSDEEVAELFNTLTTGATPDPAAYAHVKSSIESHCRTRWKVSLANLYHTHFSSPWATIAFIAALLLLILTICQTFFAAFPR
uniref:Uncharacterized protein n=1 Tax=Nelumbo nucifera TaxID=4432 RepID=A0A822ZLH9_NELNU|nr:TPA_asm: hypothetical protein HUJ06_002066 [Nelumbo nucifera]